ncbi:MAG: ATP-binding cassette domain-containing protein [Actinobacteria bacterium]|nr:ATP-binding cassette domain-containing protein [Actinomycetota bacterium]
MTELLQFALLGLGTGALYALSAQGLVVIFRGSGVLNLAHGAIAMVAAFEFNSLHVEHGWSLVPALAAAIGIAMLIGLAIDQLLLRRLRRSSPITRLIATLGVLVVLQSLGTIVWGVFPIVTPPIIAPHPVDILSTTITSDRLWLLAIATALTAVLTLVWRYTRAGWVTTAVAENEISAAAVGCSPQFVSASTWAVGAGLAGLAGILIAPISQLSVPGLTFLVVPALAVALVSGFRSFPVTLLAGLLLGIAQAEVGNYVHLTGASDALPFLVIIAVLVVRGSAMPLRGHVFDQLPLVGSGRVDRRVVGLLAAAGLAACLLITSTDWLAALSATFAIGIILLSLVLLVGYAGQLSLGQYALAGIGALVAARLVGSAGWSLALAAPVGIACASLVGSLFALPALRTRGVSLAVVTLGLGLAVNSTIFNNADLTGGADGTSVGSQSLFGFGIDQSLHPNRYAALSFVAFVLSALVVANLRRGRSGRRMLAIRANERAAVATGVNLFAGKIYAFAVSGALAGLGGILLGFASTTVTFSAFEPFASINAIAQVVVGGVGFIAAVLDPGALMSPASVGAVLAPSWESISEWLPLIGGVMLLAALLAAPDGLVAAQLGPLRKLRGRPPAQAWPLSLRAEGETLPSALPPKVLAVRGLKVSYGGVHAVDGVDLDVRPGELVGVIGPNGAGKTSLMDAITGFTPYQGSVTLGGESIDGWSARRRSQSGLVRTFQGLELFAGMTVLENILVAVERQGGTSPLRDLVAPRPPRLSAVAEAAIRELELDGVLGEYPDSLSYGERRRVSIARAVAMEPSVLLLDEPLAGLAEHESEEFAHLVIALARKWQMAVLVIEHDTDFVMGACDRVLVIDFGQPVVEGPPAEVARHPRVIEAYLGRESGEPEADGRAAVASPEGLA